MKKLNLLFAGAFAALAIVACSDDELETETNTGTDTETEEGETGDENTGDENTGDDEEEAPQAYITLSEESLRLGKEGGEVIVTVDANYGWVCAYESDWFTVVADTNAGTITVTCDANETGEVREGAVTVTTGDGEENVAEATLAITQSIYNTDDLVLEYTINEDGTEIQLPLGENDYDGNEFSVDCTVDWGDGSEVEPVNSSWPSHTYSAGTYAVIINGTVEKLQSYDNDKVVKIGNTTYYGYPIDGAECLTAVKQWGDTGLKSMECAFRKCTNLSSLPEGPGPFSNVTSFYYAFYECGSLTTVPEDMFSDCTAAENFECVFCYCYDLTSAPSFKGLSNVTSFYCAFYKCGSLTTVPEDMFSDCTAVKDFEWAFFYCYSLTSAPSFKGLSNTTDFWYAFDSCESLTTLPEDMFSGCTAVEWFGPVFAYCYSLTTVPENLFADCPWVGSFYGVFCGCTSLETVPVGIFDNNKLVTDFSWAFYNCPKLAGESPYTEIDVEGTPVRVHLYERANYPEYFTAPTTYSSCFTDSTFSDMDSIPSSWGGNGSSPTSVTPQRLNAPSPEGFGPSRLGPQRDAIAPQGPAARPLPTRK